MVPCTPSSGALVSAEIEWDEVSTPEAFPFTIPAIRAMGRIDLPHPVTFFTGENGSGKSTVVEAIAIAAGLNAEGGSRNLRFSDRETESELHRHLRLRWTTRPAWAYFFRAETFFGTATAYERVGTGGYHQRSHGEQFIEVAQQQFKAGGFHALDEPEGALSAMGQLKLLRRIHDVASDGGQFVIATHSPLLLAYPGATVYEFGDDGVRRVLSEDTPAYQLTRSFLDAPERFLRHLFSDDD